MLIQSIRTLSLLAQGDLDFVMFSFWNRYALRTLLPSCCLHCVLLRSSGVSQSRGFKLHFSLTCLISLHLYFVLNVKGHKLQQSSAPVFHVEQGSDWCWLMLWWNRLSCKQDKQTCFFFSFWYYWKVKSVGILLLSLKRPMKRKMKAVFSYQQADFLVIIHLRSPHSSFAVKVKAPHCDYDRFDSDGCWITVKQITVEENTRLNRDLLGSLICRITVLVCNWLHYCLGCVLITLFNPASRLTENTVWRFSCLWIRSCVLFTYEDIFLCCTYLFQEQTHLPSISWSLLWPGTV